MKLNYIYARSFQPKTKLKGQQGVVLHYIMSWVSMKCTLHSLLKLSMEKFVISCIFSNYLSLHHNIEARYDVFVEDFKVVDKGMVRFEMMNDQIRHVSALNFVFSLSCANLTFFRWCRLVCESNCMLI